MRVDSASEVHNVVPQPDESQLPNLLGIGAAKCGTTWLAEVLSAHPNIFMPPQKELNALHYNDLDRRLTEYAAHFAPARDAKVRCDFSVRYLASPNAPEAAKRLVPGARIMVILRNPIDQVQSHYWHLLRQNFHQGAPVWPRPHLFEALEQFPTLLLEPALYGKHLLRWRQCFPPERILVLSYAELAKNTSTTLNRICDFLDVDLHDFAPALRPTSASRARRGVQPRGGMLGAVFPALYVALAHGPYRWMKAFFGVQRAETLKRTLKLRQISEKFFFEPGYPKLVNADQIRLYQKFAADIELLASHTDIDVSSWNPAR
jgi:hypothetical protein